MVPPVLSRVWEVFSDLDAHRQHTGFGPQRLSFQEIDAYLRMEEVRLLWWERRLLSRMDGMRVEKMLRAINKDDNPSSLATGDQPITSKVFRELFSGGK